MKVVVRQAAEDDIERHCSWIAKNDVPAALKVGKGIREQINRLEIDALIEMGRPGLVAGTRELIYPPYIIVYQLSDHRQELHILSVMHGAQARS